VLPNKTIQRGQVSRKVMVSPLTYGQFEKDSKVIVCVIYITEKRLANHVLPFVTYQCP
jgi:hypothetical protein